MISGSHVRPSPSFFLAGDSLARRDGLENRTLSTETRHTVRGSLLPFLSPSFRLWRVPLTLE